MSTETIRALGRAHAASIVELRRRFHRRPELSGQERETSALVRETLSSWGVEWRLVEGPRPEGASSGPGDFIGTGILATIRGEAKGAYGDDGRPAKRVALRADMDALPVEEETGLSFASENEGVMHACGHDCHMAMELGAVRILLDMREELEGEVRVIFQPAEETARGARDMIDAGALDGVDAIYGQHVWSDVPAHAFSCESGKRMANTDWFHIDVWGASAHGSMPDRGVDAVVVAAEMVSALQALVSREISPFEPAVVTVGELHGGTARNVIADHAWFAGTVRTWSAETRDLVRDQLERICGKVAHAFGAGVEFDFETGNSVLVNDPVCSEVARTAVEELFGEEALASYQGTLAGEDFSEYLGRVPGVFVFVGTRDEALGADFPQHSCRYTVDESVLPEGAMLAAKWAVDMLSRR